MAVEFGDGVEPWSVGLGKVKRWLHCRVQVDGLPDGRRAELSTWLAGRDATDPVGTLVVTRGEGGLQLHVAGAVLDVGIEDLPVWLQRPAPEPKSAPTKRATRAA